MLMYRCEKEKSHENQLWSEREECPVESHNVSSSCDPYNSAFPESWKSNPTLITFKSTCVDLVRKMLTEMRRDPIRSCYHYSINKQNILKKSNNSRSEQMSYWGLSKASTSFFFFTRISLLFYIFHESGVPNVQEKILEAFIRKEKML